MSKVAYLRRDFQTLFCTLILTTCNVWNHLAYVVSRWSVPSDCGSFLENYSLLTGGSFIRYIGACIAGKDVKSLTGRSLEECLDACLAEQTFVCLSVDHYHSNGNCLLQTLKSDSSNFENPCAKSGWIFTKELLEVFSDINDDNDYDHTQPSDFPVTLNWQASCPLLFYFSPPC